MNSTDLSVWSTIYTAGLSAYHINADFNMDGAVNSSDNSAYLADWGTTPATGLDRLSRSDSTTLVDNRIGYAGYQWEPVVKLLHLRNRWVEPISGRFMIRDRLGYAAGVSLYEYVASRPIALKDPTGLCPGFLEECRGWIDFGVQQNRQLWRPDCVEIARRAGYGCCSTLNSLCGLHGFYPYPQDCLSAMNEAGRNCTNPNLPTPGPSPAPAPEPAPPELPPGLPPGIIKPRPGQPPMTCHDACQAVRDFYLEHICPYLGIVPVFGAVSASTCAAQARAAFINCVACCPDDNTQWRDWASCLQEFVDHMENEGIPLLGMDMAAPCCGDISEH